MHRRKYTCEAHLAAQRSRPFGFHSRQADEPGCCRELVLCSGISCALVLPHLSCSCSHPGGLGCGTPHLPCTCCFAEDTRTRQRPQVMKTLTHTRFTYVAAEHKVRGLECIHVHTKAAAITRGQSLLHACCLLETPACMQLPQGKGADACARGGSVHQ